MTPWLLWSGAVANDCRDVRLCWASWQREGVVSVVCDGGHGFQVGVAGWRSKGHERYDRTICLSDLQCSWTIASSAVWTHSIQDHKNIQNQKESKECFGIYTVPLPLRCRHIGKTWTIRVISFRHNHLLVQTWTIAEAHPLKARQKRGRSCIGSTGYV